MARQCVDLVTIRYCNLTSCTNSQLVSGSFYKPNTNTNYETCNPQVFTNSDLVTFAPDIFSLTINQGILIGTSILLVWTIGYAYRAVQKAMGDDDNYFFNSKSD